MAASLAALPSIVIVSGTSWRRIAFFRKRSAAASSRCSVKRKSMVCPVLSMARERVPLAFHLDGGCVHPPTDPHRPLVAVKRCLQLWTVCDDSAVDRGMIHVDTPFEHECFDMARAEGRGHVPADTRENDRWREVGTLEAHRHRLSLALVIMSHRERAYPKSPQMKIYDRTLMIPGSNTT